jgi:hypothetical protein
MAGGIEAGAELAINERPIRALIIHAFLFLFCIRKRSFHGFCNFLTARALWQNGHADPKDPTRLMA